MSETHPAHLAGAGYDRVSYDYYITPPDAVIALLKEVGYRFSTGDVIWEPASGNGAISRILEKAYPECKIISSDIRTTQDVYGERGVDLLRAGRDADWIITNPPFNLALEFVLHALKHARKGVFMLMRLSYLAGIERYNQLWSRKSREIGGSLHTLYVIPWRLEMKRGGDDKRPPTSMIDYAWFFFTSYKQPVPHEPIIMWLEKPKGLGDPFVDEEKPTEEDDEIYRQMGM